MDQEARYLTKLHNEVAYWRVAGFIGFFVIAFCFVKIDNQSKTISSLSAAIDTFCPEAVRYFQSMDAW
jgi:hypothetical protein